MLPAEREDGSRQEHPRPLEKGCFGVGRVGDKGLGREQDAALQPESADAEHLGDDAAM